MAHQSDQMKDIGKAVVDFDPFAAGSIQRTTPTTESQKEIWLSVQLGGDAANCAYNESVILTIHGALHFEAMEQAFQEIFQRHEALRGSISADGNTFCIAEGNRLEIPLLDVSNMDEVEKKSVVNSLLDEEVTTPFNLGNGPLFRAKIVKYSQDEFRVVFTGHHVVMDGWSTSLVIKELDAIYNAIIANRIPSLPISVQFSEYVQFISSDEQRLHREKVENYWVDQYKDGVPVLDLPTSFKRPLGRSFHANSLIVEIEEELVSALKKLGARTKCSLTVVMMAGLKILLHRITKQEKIVVGIPAAGQSLAGMGQVVGHCVNILPIKSSINNESTVLDYLHSLQPVMFDAYDHQELTFGSLLKKLKIERDPGRIPLVSILFNIDPGFSNLTIGGHKATIKTNLRKFENFEWFINGTLVDGKVTLECHYNAALFDQRTMQLRMGEFNAVLSAMVGDPNKRINDLNIIPAEEFDLQIWQWNATVAEYPINQCVHDLFKKQAVASSDKVAVTFEERCLTYGELDHSSEQLALYLKRIGVKPGSFVGIYMARSIEMVVALLGTLKAGGTYVPLDPEYPRERLAYMIEDAGIDILLTQRYLPKPGDSDSNIQAIYIEGQWEQELLASSNELSSIAQPSWNAPGAKDLAYVIYTSGSTGKPKGVEISHGAFVNFLHSMAKQPGITFDDILLAVTTLSFDIAGLEIFLPLLNGASVRLVSRDTAMDANELIRELEETKATIMQATPSTWRMMFDSGWKGSRRLKVLCGGEPFPRDLVRRLVSGCHEVWNMYGPTETTVWSTCYRFTDPEDRILIGRPLDNTQCYVLESNLQPSPVGVAGELYIGGAGVARGRGGPGNLDKPLSGKSATTTTQ